MIAMEVLLLLFGGFFSSTPAAPVQLPASLVLARARAESERYRPENIHIYFQNTRDLYLEVGPSVDKIRARYPGRESEPLVIARELARAAEDFGFKAARGWPEPGWRAKYLGRSDPNVYGGTGEQEVDEKVFFRKV